MKKVFFINKKILKLIIILLGYLFVGCSNIFKPAANIYTDKALYYQGNKELDNRNYQTALQFFDQMSESFASSNAVRLKYASALAGACGMEFITFFENIKNADVSQGGSLFKYLMSSFTDYPTTPNYCTLAEAKIKAIGATATDRLAATGKGDSSIFMAILAMAKIGSYLRSNADVDGTNSNGDGTTDLSFDPCIKDATNGFESTEVDEIATGFGLLLENLPALLGSSNSTAQSLQAASLLLSPICALPTINVTSTNCVVTDISSVPEGELKNFRYVYRILLAYSAIGIGNVGTLDIATCPSGAPD